MAEKILMQVSRQSEPRSTLTKVITSLFWWRSSWRNLERWLF